ncbi:lipid-A-disaccharide synthase [Hydrogenophaga sp.]|nr:lipid-A-disaccharide synthase [Hydrogenophaga sp.]HMP08963.1 lipid-A-disaccharide synthase [Hydrogenophaga sp.]
MVVGEASGDLLGSLLLQGLRRRWPGLQANGIGGPNLERVGMHAWWSCERLSVRGYVEVLPRLREILRIRRQLGDRLLGSARPDVFIGVDAPDFNLDLEVRLRQQGIPTVHFVCPSIWAWRAGKVAKLARAADHVLCLFPFEPELLSRHGIASTYVGHPLASVIPMEPDRVGARGRLGLPPEAEVVAILPGSRVSEIEYLGERFLRAADLMRRRRSGLRFVLPAVPALKPQIDALAARFGLGGALTVVAGQSHDALAACDVTLIASGTATLEAALFKRPMVIAYNMHWLSWQMMRRKRLQPWVGLPNILAQAFVVPELLQDEATPAALAQATLAWLDEPARMASVQARFARLHRDLTRDTVQLATDAIEKLLAS